jgi:hypothetical protein
MRPILIRLTTNDLSVRRLRVEPRATVQRGVTGEQMSHPGRGDGVPAPRVRKRETSERHDRSEVAGEADPNVRARDAAVDQCDPGFARCAQQIARRCVGLGDARRNPRTGAPNTSKVGPSKWSTQVDCPPVAAPANMRPVVGVAAPVPSLVARAARLAWIRFIAADWDVPLCSVARGAPGTAAGMSGRPVGKSTISVRTP